MTHSALPYLILGITCSAHAADDLEHAFGTEEAISLATGYTQPLFEAPASATVLTAADLQAVGAQTVQDALQLVPGFLVQALDGRASVTTVRGITSRTLILVDGIPVPSTLLQHYMTVDYMLLNNVKRLEIVRGPASSVYGADAVAGVINVVTKTSANSEGEVGVVGGSLDTYGGWLRQDLRLSAADISIYLGGRSTDVNDEIIASDLQSSLDARQGTNLSRAPMQFPTKRDLVEARADARIGNWTVRAHYQDIYNAQWGFTGALSPTATADSRLYGSTVLYKSALSPSLEFSGFLDYGNVNQPAEGDLFPPGAFGNAFPDGVLVAYEIENDRLRSEGTLLFTGWNRHTVRLGAGVLRNEFRVNYENRNFIVRGGQFLPTGTFGPHGGVDDRWGLPDVNQTTYYGYLQDQWAIARDWNLTYGVRADEYSDVGGTINPRAALVWNSRRNLTFKALYGRAFRPPSIFESYSEGVYTARGSSRVKPTTLDSAEVSANFRTEHMSTSVTLFSYQQDELIQVIPDAASPRGTSYINRGSETGSGAEIETTITLPYNFRLHGGYAYQERHGDNSQQNVNVRFSVPHAVNFDVTWNYNDWRAGLASLSVFDRKRGRSDSRPPAEDYTLVNASLIRRNIAGLFDVSFSVHNLFDEDARDQSESLSSVAFDIPRPGRSYLMTLSTRR
jgi:iron complex outermembrane receptor protein